MDLRIAYQLEFDLRVWLYTGAVWLVIVTLWFLRPLSRQAAGKRSGP